MGSMNAATHLGMRTSLAERSFAPASTADRRVNSVARLFGVWRGGKLAGESLSPSFGLCVRSFASSFGDFCSLRGGMPTDDIVLHAIAIKEEPLRFIR